MVKEDLFVLSGARVVRNGSRRVNRFERDPDKIWLGNSLWYLNLKDFTLIHEREQLGTAFSVDPSVLLHTQLVHFGEKIPDGSLVRSPTVTWFEISNQLDIEPNFRFEFCNQPQKFEHFLAGGFFIEGWDPVIVTPRSGDKGRDVIAEQSDKRILQEAKAYKATRCVSAEQVRALCHVKERDKEATKALVTTTSSFAPGIVEEFCGEHYAGWLETMNGAQFVGHVGSISTSKQATFISSKLFQRAGVSTKQGFDGRIITQRQLRSLQQCRDPRF